MMKPNVVTDTAVSFIGDFNYSILDRVQLEDLEGFSAFNNYIQPENSGHADEENANKFMETFF